MNTSELLPRPDVARSQGGVRARLEDCTSAVEDRLRATLARDRLVRDCALHAGNPVHNADVETLLHEVEDLNRRLRSATHTMQQALSAIDDEQYHARVRVARERLEGELEGLVADFGGEQ